MKDFNREPNEPREKYSGGERAAAQTLRDIRKSCPIASAFGVAVASAPLWKRFTGIAVQPDRKITFATAGARLSRTRAVKKLLTTPET